MRDVIIVIAVVVIGSGLVAAFFLFSKKGSLVIVSVNGREVARYGLNEDVNTVIQGEGGSNRLIIRDGEAWIEEADCPDKLCVRQGHISRTNESLVCLPHRITVRIAGEAENEPDAIVSDVLSETPPARTLLIPEVAA